MFLSSLDTLLEVRKSGEFLRDNGSEKRTCFVSTDAAPLSVLFCPRSIATLCVDLVTLKNISVLGWLSIFGEVVLRILSVRENSWMLAEAGLLSEGAKCNVVQRSKG